MLHVRGPAYKTWLCQPYWVAGTSAWPGGAQVPAGAPACRVTIWPEVPVAAVIVGGLAGGAADQRRPGRCRAAIGMGVYLQMSSGWPAAFQDLPERAEVLRHCRLDLGSGERGKKPQPGLGEIEFDGVDKPCRAGRCRCCR